ncbi:phosphate acetyltransferase, partial [Escherichia coli]|nr:phosphate acetyltransferase [Escherichia coli]
TEDIAKFTAELQKYNRYFGSSDLTIIGLVPFSNTLSVPRTFDIASVIDVQWINQVEAKTRRILHSSLIASSNEYELNKFIAGELIISASESTDV